MVDSLTINRPTYNRGFVLNITRPSMSILKSWGDRMSSWRTPLVTLKLSEMQAPHLTVISCF